MKLTIKVLVSALILLAGIVPATSHAASCSKTQALTEGPYYSIDTPERSNITDQQLGTMTKLTLTVVDTNCKAVVGARVDIWHANAAGEYSAVHGNSDNYLRGTQITNARGQITFTTIYPGWYLGRTMHIHFKVIKDGAEVLTSQFFASDSINSKIYTSGAYAARGNQNTALKSDQIYRSLTKPSSLLLNVKIGKTITATGKLVI